jgi:phospholipid transport system substrate-binding protein
MALALSVRALPLGALAVLLASVALSEARAEDCAELATRFVQRLGTEAIAPGRTGPSDSATARLDTLLEKFDFIGFGQLTLGAGWASASLAQRRDFGAALTARFGRSYAPYLVEYAGGQLEVIGSRGVVGGNALVASRIVDAGGQHPIRIDWFVRDCEGGAPKIGDVIVAGISMARTDAEEFASAMRSSGLGLDGLLHQLHEQYPASVQIGAVAK